MATRAIIQPTPQMRRLIRRPSHTFQLRTIPYTIQPFLLAPVLPGETMKNLLMQSRCVTDVIKTPLVGWWNEYYFFYVRQRDLELREEYTQMMVDGSWTPAAVKSESSSLFHYFAGQAGQNWINWSAQCLERVVLEYFRNDGEEWDDFLIDGKPAASINQQSWLDSVQPDADYEQPDLAVQEDAGEVLMASEVERAMAQYELLRLHGLTQQTYEEYLRTYGVRVQEPEQHIPELIRYVRDWSYPTNTINPEDGSPSSAVSWSIQERADKDRFFAEPGFIYGVTVKRPKVYLSKQAGNAAALMNNVFAWLPATMQQVANASMMKVDEDKGPLTDTTDDYWVDMRDLLMYGDQFLNFSLTETDAGLVALPTPGLQKRYVADLAAVKALFVEPDDHYFVREDGIVNLHIAGRQIDRSPPINTVPS